MKFQIKSIRESHKPINLSLPTDNNENIYTILVGRNASGKTTLLSKVVRNYLFEQQSDFHETQDSLPTPRQVIAVSNSRFDRFPVPEANFYRRSRHTIDYHYLGFSGIRYPQDTISKSIASLIYKSEIEKDPSSQLANIFDYIGFLPYLQIELRASSAIGSSSMMRSNPVSTWKDRFYRINDRFGSDHELDFETDILPGLEYFTRNFVQNNQISIQCDLQHGWWGSDAAAEYIKYIPHLINSRLFKISNLQLIQRHSKNKIPLRSASSGQQCMLLMFLGMAGLIKDGSLICIDEPEISLHPRWQTEFIGILQKAFSNYRGCHFLIATHSPQLVSGLISSNGFVADLETNNLLMPHEYSKKSADFQLSEIFHEPGFKNEYLIRILLVIISKLSKGEELSSEDRYKLKTVNYIRSRLDAADPVLHLLNQVKMMVD